MLQKIQEKRCGNSSSALWQTVAALLGGKLDYQSLSKHEMAGIIEAFQRQQGELLKQNQTLQSMVSEHENARCDLLHKQEQLQEQLRKQERMALVGQLSAGVAHDFNNTLLAVTASAEVLSRKYAEDEYLEVRLKRILQQSGVAAQLVRQILDFGRLNEATAVTSEVTTFVAELSDLISHVLPSNTIINFVSNCPPERAVLMGQLQLQQILLNLAINGHHAMPEGGLLDIRLSDEQVTENRETITGRLLPGHWVRIDVTDHGLGIDSDTMPHILEPFFTTKAIDKGSGLGLTQVRTIVEQHGGKLHVESQPGIQTTFSIFLRPSESVKQPIALGGDAAELLQGDGKTIILLENNHAVQLPTTELLEALNYQVLIYSDGRELVEDMRAGVVEGDLILADISLPFISSAELVARLKLLAPSMPLVLMNGHVPESQRRLKAVGNVKALLQKPFTMIELAQTIHSAI